MKLSKKKGAVIAALIAISFVSFFSAEHTQVALDFSTKETWTEEATPQGGKRVTYQKDYRVDYQFDEVDKLSILKKTGKVK